MKITKIETTVYEDKLLPQLFETITTDEGLRGIGEAWYGLPVKPIESAINHVPAIEMLFKKYDQLRSHPPGSSTIHDRCDRETESTGRLRRGT